MVWVVVGVAVIALLALWLVLTYNRLVALRLACENSWSQVDVALKLRHDLVPNLVETVAGYARHERGTLERVTAARAEAVAADDAPATARGAAEAALGQQLGLLLGVTVEAYPDLKAAENFRDLQARLVAVEDKLQITRRVYNDTVESYNGKLQSFPTLLVAGPFGFAAREFFAADVAAHAAPAVLIDGGAA